MQHKKHTHHTDETPTGTPEMQTPSAEDATTGDVATAVSSDYEELQQKLKSAQDNAAQAESLYQRMAADFENYRKRIDRERQEFLNFGLQRAAEALFPALDDLDRAQTGLSTQMTPEDLLESMKLVFNRVRESAKQIGLQSIEAVGEHFDPQFHEPVQKVEASEQFPDGTVTEVLRKGYMLNGKVIRPALVNVAHGTD